MNYPLQAPDPPAVFKPRDFVGEVCMFLIGGFHEQLPTENWGVKPAERVTAILMTGRSAGKAYEDIVLFGQRQSSQFAEKAPGSAVLCRISKAGQAINFDNASPYDYELANNWIAANGPRFDQLKKDAVNNYQRACQELQANGGAVQSRSNVQASPQFQPSQTVTADATRQSLQEPGEPASPQETGY